MGYDLHIHSIYSDGTYPPRELIAKAIMRGLNGIAITDHDTIDGFDEAVKEAERLRFLCIPGVELTTDYGASEVHILGYNFCHDHVPLRKKLKEVIESRNERARLIVKKLHQHNIPLSWEKVQAQTTSKFVGRTHIFKAMEVSGFLKRAPSREAFAYYLGKDGVAFVPHGEIGTEEAIELINQSGGIAVLAHPGRMGDDLLIPKLVEFGLRGIEVYYPAHTPDMVLKYLNLARELNLIVTGGSDYHGKFSQTRMGESQVGEISGWFHPASGDDFHNLS
jgi:3',5'-nucleoside bisphosphate phosphatase